ncbi:MAG TPA: hypothetical protein VFI29_10965 [Hanamia sp.]|nr:hypothetical protein [Hanamia sp.]
MEDVLKTYLRSFLTGDGFLNENKPSRAFQAIQPYTSPLPDRFQSNVHPSKHLHFHETILRQK